MKIHVSENTKLLLDQIGGFHLEKRGTIEIKASVYDFCNTFHRWSFETAEILNPFQKLFCLLMCSATILFGSKIWYFLWKFEGKRIHGNVLVTGPWQTSGNEQVVSSPRWWNFWISSWTWVFKHDMRIVRNRYHRCKEL